MQLHFHLTESPRVLLSCSCISTRQNPLGFCYLAAAFLPDWILGLTHFYQTCSFYQSKSFRILLPCRCIFTRLNSHFSEGFFYKFILYTFVFNRFKFYNLIFYTRIFIFDTVHLIYVWFYMWLVVISVFFKLVVRNILKYSLWVQGWKTAIAIFLDPPATLFVL